MKQECRVSIVTPTYNRAKLIRRCYESLVKQTSKNFEWIIVDDGSTDNTEEVVRDIKNCESSFRIEYVKKSNGGKHTALNASHKYINGEYVLILDSDDYLTEDAVERVLTEWKAYDDNSEIGVVTFLRGIDKENPLAFSETEKEPVELMRCKRVCVHSSDCCEVIRTELFKKYPFPEYDNERFVAETVLWYRVGFEKKYVYVNEVVYICQYLDDGLTNAGRAMRIKNPMGGMLNSELGMDRRNYFKLRIKNGLLFVCYGFFAGLGIPKIINYSTKFRLIKAVCIAPGYVMYTFWKKKYSEA